MRPLLTPVRAESTPLCLLTGCPTAQGTRARQTATRPSAFPDDFANPDFFLFEESSRRQPTDSIDSSTSTTERFFARVLPRARTSRSSCERAVFLACLRLRRYTFHSTNTSRRAQRLGHPPQVLRPSKQSQRNEGRAPA